MKYEYQEADKYVVVNNGDTDLHPIVLSLPTPPPLHTIDGYGLPPEDQRFRRLAIPKKLKDLEVESVIIVQEEAKKNKNKEVTLLKIQHEFWRLLSERHKEYKKEIDFIRRVWWMRLNGMWFFSRGIPTWITGRHFYYLNFFKMDTDTGYAEYRDCDRREYVFMEYCWTATETFAKTDRDGYAIKNEDGTYDMVDLIRRVCLGSAQSKNRRRGNTSKAISDGMEVTTRTFGTDGFGLQSYSEENARAHFKMKVIPAWEGLPIWLKPFSKSGRNSNSLKFDVDQNDYIGKGLSTQVVYANTSSPKAFDGKKFKVLLTDEEGKELVSGTVAKRWEVNKHVLAQGDGMVIHGFSYHPSTADQQSAGAFDYYYLVQSSNFYRRIPVKGQTISGLFRIFIPAQDGLEGFIDSYGYSVTGEIRDYQKKEGFTVTAEEYLQGERDILNQDGSPEAMAKLREHKKLYPMKFSDSWLGTSGNIGFDMEKIDKRLAEKRSEDNCVVGRLEWIDGVQFSEVYFEEDQENGDFVISKMPFDHVSNKVTGISFFNPFSGKEETHLRPMYPGHFTVGSDTFKNAGKGDQKTIAMLGKKSYLSDGGIACLWNYDPDIDSGKKLSDAESYRFVVTYRGRKRNTDLYNEDVAKVCFFWGAMLYPETNLTNTFEYFVNNGLGGFLIYDIDKFTGRLKDKPGVDSLERSKQDIFQLWRDYIDYRCHKEEHVDLLKELKDITSIDQMRYFDQIAAGGMALMGAKSPYVNKLKGIENNGYDISDFIDF